MTKQDVGVLTGGALGGLVGSRFGGGQGRIVSAVAGSVIGGLVGGAIGNSMDQADRMNVSRVLERTPTGRTTSWRNPDSGAEYSVRPTKTYFKANKQPCREYITTANIGGKKTANLWQSLPYCRWCLEGCFVKEPQMFTDMHR